MASIQPRSPTRTFRLSLAAMGRRLPANATDEVLATVLLMPLNGQSNYAKATDALEQAWEAITDPSGQALEAEANRIPWAAAAIGVGIGHALLALSDEIATNDD